MDLKCNKNCHSQYRLEYHLVLATKYGNPASPRKCSST